jgi:hypothetical protein
VIRSLGADAGIRLSAHVLRHSFCTNLMRAGHDLVLVAELAGHRRLDATRHYSLPSTADKQAAIDTSLSTTERTIAPGRQGGRLTQPASVTLSAPSKRQRPSALPTPQAVPLHVARLVAELD